MTVDKPTKSKVKSKNNKKKSKNNKKKSTNNKVNPTKSKVNPTKSNVNPTKSKVNSTKGKVKPKNSQMKSKNNKKESTKSKVNPTINNLKSTNNNKQPEVFYYKTKGGYYYKQTQNGGSLRVSEGEYIGGAVGILGRAAIAAKEKARKKFRMNQKNNQVPYTNQLSQQKPTEKVEMPDWPIQGQYPNAPVVVGKDAITAARERQRERMLLEQGTLTDYDPAPARPPRGRPVTSRAASSIKNATQTEPL